MELIFSIILSAFFMRIKGGMMPFPLLGGKGASAILFCLLVFFLSGDPVLGLLAGLAWFIGCVPAVRDYLINLGGYLGPFEFTGWGQHPIIVKICHFLAGLYFLNRPVEGIALRKFYGWTGTVLRGMAMGVPLAVAFKSLPLLIVGPAMAPCYFAGMSVLQYVRAKGVKRSVYRRYFDGWSLGEWFWGGVIGFTVKFFHDGGLAWMKYLL